MQVGMAAASFAVLFLKRGLQSLLSASPIEAGGRLRRCDAWAYSARVCDWVGRSAR